MSGLLFLEPSDFHYEESDKKTGSIMCTHIKDISLVLYYGKNCPNCQILLPIFKRIPGKISGVFIGICLVNNDLANMARTTVMPFTHVPMMVVYLDGRPYTRYEAEYSEKGILSFLQYVIQNLQQKVHFYKQMKQTQYQGQGQQQLQQQQQPQQRQVQQQSNTTKTCKYCHRIKKQQYCSCVIPSYSLGVPCDMIEDDVTYLEFNEAYQIKNKI